MNELKPNLIREVLAALSDNENKLLANLASSLVPAADEASLELSSPLCREVKDIISIAMGLLAENDRGPAAVLDALIEIDIALAQKGASVPWAARLAPLVAERAVHAAKERWSEKQKANHAENSPIFRLDDRTIIAAPIDPLGTESVARFADRILAAVLKNRPKRVVLVLNNLDSKTASAREWISLAEDLKAQKVRLERID
ncbi:MAG: hypothetical protein GY854_03425 [Deltaproteobacteria bacterium]|nr:hypothetical protein [Deltaproteobacteria bacterium]